MKRWMLFGVLFLLFASFAAAKDITFSVNQTEYYFLIGEEGRILLDVDNTYRSGVDGVLSYTFEQQVNQGGVFFSSTNTQSTNLRLEKGESTIPIGIGTSDSPMTIKLSFVYTFTQKDQRVVTLDGITVHFVEQQQQQQSSSGKQSSSQKTAQPKQQLPEPQSTQEKLQNRQLQQDSSALRNELQQQLADEQQKRDAFAQAVSEQEEFQQKQQELLDQGFSASGKQVSAESLDTGSFSFSYESSTGEQAQLQGTMQNGSLQNIQKQTEEQRNELLSKMQQHKDFQKFAEQLTQEGFSYEQTQIASDVNGTVLSSQYRSELNETATIHATAINETITHVELERSESDRYNLFWILVGLVFVGALLVWWVSRKKEVVDLPVDSEVVFDYRKESHKLLRNAEKLFSQKKYKEAYGEAAKSLRLFLRYEQGITDEITNDALLSYLKKEKKPHLKIKRCFDLCSYVEFAKYKANKKDFDKIVTVVKKTIGK